MKKILYLCPTLFLFFFTNCSKGDSSDSPSTANLETNTLETTWQDTNRFPKEKFLPIVLPSDYKATKTEVLPDKEPNMLDSLLNQVQLEAPFSYNPFPVKDGTLEVVRYISDQTERNAIGPDPLNYLSTFFFYNPEDYWQYSWLEVSLEMKAVLVHKDFLFQEKLWLAKDASVFKREFFFKPASDYKKFKKMNTDEDLLMPARLSNFIYKPLESKDTPAKNPDKFYLALSLSYTDTGTRCFLQEQIAKRKSCPSLLLSVPYATKETDVTFQSFTTLEERAKNEDPNLFLSNFVYYRLDYLIEPRTVNEKALDLADRIKLKPYWDTLLNYFPVYAPDKRRFNQTYVKSFYRNPAKEASLKNERSHFYLSYKESLNTKGYTKFIFGFPQFAAYSGEGPPWIRKLEDEMKKFKNLYGAALK